MGLPAESQAEVASWLENDQEPDEVHFDTKQQVLFFLREAIQMCYLDGHFSDAERSCLEEISSRSGISQASIAYIEDWVKEGMEWRREGDILLSLEA
jgi:hypothetical protein